LLGAVIPSLSGCNCRRLGHSLSSVSPSIRGDDVHPYTQAARRLPALHTDVARMLTIVALCKPILEFIIFDLYNYVMECC
jgi:hypothetical protein